MSPSLFIVCSLKHWNIKTWLTCSPGRRHWIIPTLMILIWFSCLHYCSHIGSVLCFSGRLTNILKHIQHLWQIFPACHVGALLMESESTIWWILPHSESIFSLLSFRKCYIRATESDFSYFRADIVFYIFKDIYIHSMINYDLLQNKERSVETLWKQSIFLRSNTVFLIL